MIADLKPYSEYKVSDQDWFGSVPLHWSVLPNRAIFEEVKDRNHPDEEMLSVTITRGIVRQKTLLANSSKKDSSNLNKSAYKLVQPHDIAYNKMRAWQGAIGVSNFRGIISPAYVVMRLRKSKNLPRYFHHLYRTPMFAKEAERWSYGITSDMWSLRPEHFKMIYTPEPPEEEQATIVRFLNWVNNRLGRAIKAKQKQIELLNEQKQAIIHGRVTRGLDPSVPLKPSGMPWLGEIPTHWDVRKLRTCAELIVSNVDKHSHVNEKPVRLCNYTDVYKNEHITSTLNFMHATATDEEILKFRIRVGDVVITKDSEEWDDIGVPSFVAYEDDDLVCGYHLAILRPRRDLVLGDFLFRTLQDRFVATQMHISAKGVTRYGLSHQGIKDIIIPLPPKNEQMSICTTLSRDLERFDIIRARLEREIDLLQEYRTRLIADVVTGKLDVREAAAKLPEEEIEEIAEVNEDLESDDEEIAV